MNCRHLNTEPRRRTKSNGIVVVSIQCLDCGMSRGERSKQSFDVSKLKDFDDSIPERFLALQKLELESHLREEHDRWWASYHDYLLSEHWRNVRRIVLARDPICCVCFSSSSAQAHHLTYESFNKHGISFPVECVGVCDICHDRLHKE